MSAPSPAHRLADEEARRTLHGERGRVELRELHARDLGARLVAERHAVAGGRLRVGAVAPEAARATAREHHRRRREVGGLRRRAVGGDRHAAAHSVARGEDRRDVGVLDDTRAARAQAADQRRLDLEPGAVATRVQDARARVRGLLREQQLTVLRVEGDAPFDQLADPRGPFLDEDAHRVRMAQARGPPPSCPRNATPVKSSSPTAAAMPP